MRSFASTAVACAALIVAASVVSSPRALSQEASSNERLPHSQVLGYQDPATGVFHPIPLVVPEAGTVPPVAGSITVTLHITLKTAVPSGDKVACRSDLVASYSSTAGAHTYVESGSVFGTVSGSSATCTVVIPFSWQFPAVSSTDIESLTGSYTAEIVNPTSTFVTLVPLVRSSTSNFVSLTGNNIFTVTTLAYSANVTL